MSSECYRFLLQDSSIVCVLKRKNTPRSSSVLFVFKAPVITYKTKKASGVESDPSLYLKMSINVFLMKS